MDENTLDVASNLPVAWDSYHSEIFLGWLDNKTKLSISIVASFKSS